MFSDNARQHWHVSRVHYLSLCLQQNTFSYQQKERFIEHLCITYLILNSLDRLSINQSRSKTHSHEMDYRYDKEVLNMDLKMLQLQQFCWAPPWWSQKDLLGEASWNHTSLASQMTSSIYFHQLTAGENTQFKGKVKLHHSQVVINYPESANKYS